MAEVAGGMEGAGAIVNRGDLSRNDHGLRRR
jgi:hypothetical protein